MVRELNSTESRLKGTFKHGVQSHFRVCWDRYTIHLSQFVEKNQIISKNDLVMNLNVYIFLAFLYNYALLLVIVNRLQL